MFGVHAEVLMPGVPQARDEQRRAHDHGQRQRHLQTREQIEQPRGPLGAGVPGAERETVRESDRRSHAEQERGRCAECDGENEQASVERRRERCGGRQKELTHHGAANSHDCQRRHARADREPPGLEHHLAQQSDAARAERGLDEELASSPEAADEEQAGHVAAREQEHEDGDARHQDFDSRLQGCTRSARRTQIGKNDRSRSTRQALRRGLICRRCMVAGAGATDAGPEPRNRLEGEEHLTLPLWSVAKADAWLERQPDVDRRSVDSRKAARCHGDDGVSVHAKPEWLAQHVRSSSKRLLPESIADHRRVLARRIRYRRPRSDQRLNAEHGKVLGRVGDGLDASCVLPASERQLLGKVGGACVDFVVQCGQRFVRRIAHAVGSRPTRPAEIDPRNPIGVGDVRRDTQQQAVEDVDHDHRRSNPDRQDRDGAQREDRRRCEPPECLPNVCRNESQPQPP